MGVQELCTACERGDLEWVKAEIRSGANPKEEWDRYGYAAIHFAASNGRCSIVRYLIEHCRVGVDEKTKRGSTALHRAAGNGQEAVVKMLVNEFNADETIKDKNGKTALDVAIMNNKPSSE